MSNDWWSFTGGTSSGRRGRDLDHMDQWLHAESRDLNLDDLEYEGRQGCCMGPRNPRFSLQPRSGKDLDLADSLRRMINLPGEAKNYLCFDGR